MLGKVLKYDLKSIFKFLTVFYILAIFFSVLTRIFLNIEGSFVITLIGQIFSGVTISMMFNILINNTMRLWVRFKGNFYGDESYLTHTLPVKKGTLYLSKALTALISWFVSLLVISATIFIAYYSGELFESIAIYFKAMAIGFDTSVFALLFSIIFILFLEIANIIQAGFTGIILGHKMNNGKTGMSVLFGFITYSITQTLVLLFVFVVALFDKDIMSLFTSSNSITPEALKTSIALSMVIYTALLAIVYFMNIKLFKKGVDVD